MLKRVLRRAQRGLGLVELMVGLAVGLFVVAGGLLMFAGFVDSDRNLVVETRLMQDLRAAADLVTRDIRRGGYWANAHTSVWTSGAGTTPRNPFALVSSAACAASAAGASQPTGVATSTCYWIDNGANAVANDSEKYGFEVDGGVLYSVLAGGARVALTDPKTITVTGLTFDWSGTQTIAASEFCAKTCVSNCPTVVVREVAVTITGTAPGVVPAMTRRLRNDVRVRNDLFTGQCPA